MVEYYYKLKITSVDCDSTTTKHRFSNILLLTVPAESMQSMILIKGIISKGSADVVTTAFWTVTANRSQHLNKSESYGLNIFNYSLGYQF